MLRFRIIIILISFLEIIILNAGGWVKGKQIGGYLDDRIERQSYSNPFSRHVFYEDIRFVNKTKSTFIKTYLIESPTDILNLMSIDEKSNKTIIERNNLVIKTIPYINKLNEFDYKILTDTSTIPGYNNPLSLKRIKNKYKSSRDTINILLWTAISGNLFCVKFEYKKSILAKIHIDTILTNTGHYISIE